MPGAKRSDADFSRSEVDSIKHRDGYRCLACGSPEITIQHRVSKGMGGLGDKAPKLTMADGILLCWHHNSTVEGKDQALALRRGWKVRRFAPLHCSDIPVYDAMSGNWYLLGAGGGRRWVDPGWAMDRVRTANGLT